MKLNVLGPRGGAQIDHRHAGLPLRAAVEGWEPYIWIVSDTKHQACSHLENIKAELLDNPRLAADYPDAVGRGLVWRQNAVTLAQRRDDRGLRHRPADPRPAPPRASAHAHRLRRPAERRPHPLGLQREHSRSWFHGTLMKAGTARTNVVNLATALHREALAMELHRTPGWTSRLFKAIVRWPDNMSLWQQWEADLHRPRARPTTPRPHGRSTTQHRAEMEAGAIVLWPEEEDLYTLMCMRVEEGRTAFEREKQNSPINPDLCEWPESYFDDWHLVRGLAGRSAGEDDGASIRARAATRGAATTRRWSCWAWTGRGCCTSRPTWPGGRRRRSWPTASSGSAAFGPTCSASRPTSFKTCWPASSRRSSGGRALRRLAVAIENQHEQASPHSPAGAVSGDPPPRFKTAVRPTRLLVEQLQEFPVGDHDDGPDAAEMAIRLAGELLDGRRAGDGLGTRFRLSV